MKTIKASFILSLIFVASVLQLQAQIFIVPPTGKAFAVNDTSDTPDVNLGDLICADAAGRCTLRAAVQEVNAAGTDRGDVIYFILPQPAIIELTLGELSITGRFVSIVGPGARRLTIRRSSSATTNFRIFNLPAGQSNYLIRGLTISNGSGGSEPGGGAVRVAAGANLSLTEVTLTGNAAASGGGVFNEGTLEVARSLFSSNSSDGPGTGVFFGKGAAIFNAPNATVRISNSTITSNSGVVGSAIYNHGTVTLANNTVSHNSATASAAAIFNNPSGTVNIINTIVASNGSAAITALSGSFTSFGNNLITDARNSAGFTAGTMGDQVGNNDAIDPRLGPLSDNGGQTDTRALLPGSPAIDAANGCVFNGQCNLPQSFPPGPSIRLFSDQRRVFLRTSGLGGGGNVVDIGAYEAGSSQFSSGVSFGSFGAISPGRLVGTASFTDVATGEKRFTAITPFGSFRFMGSPTSDGIYVLEYITKRQPAPGPQVLDLRLF